MTVCAVLIGGCGAAVGISNPLVADDVTGFREPKTAQVISTYPVGIQQMNDITVGGLSGLAWDQDENRLYAVSDLGNLYHFNIIIKENNIEEVKLTGAYPLRDETGQALTGRSNDAEGLDVANARNGISGDTELIIAYERRPRVTRHSPDGAFLESITIGETLASKKHYRNPNNSLETVLQHSELGLLLGPEVAMSGQDPLHHTVFNQNGDQSWEFMAGSYENASFTGMAEMGNGDILALERAFAGVTKPFYIALRWIKISNCVPDSVCESRPLTVLNSQEHSNLDNFEGLAKLDNYYYLMISDDNESSFQRTLLSLILLQ